MKDTKTQRGFEITGFKDSYGAICSLQESSSAMEPKIWLGVNSAEPKILVPKVGWVDYPIHKDVSLYTRMHLNIEQVKELLPYLNRFVETGSIH